MVLDMEGQRLGVEAEPASDGSHLYVKDIKPGGAVSNWNLQTPPESNVLIGDHVISINEVKGAEAMINECKAGRKQLVLVVEGVIRTNTPETAGSSFKILLDLSSGLKMGLDMDFRSDPRAIIVKNVMPDGAVGQWNKSNPPHLSVNIGDRIVAVNDISGDATKMVNEGSSCFKAKRNISMTLESRSIVVSPGEQNDAARGTKRSAEEMGGGVDAVAVFVQQTFNERMGEMALNFMRQQTVENQQKIIDRYKLEASKYSIMDPIGQFFAIARKILN